jgi:hypothetical protein
MIHIRVHREGFLDDVVRALAFEVCDETYTARVFLVGRMPKALGFGPAKWGSLRDGHKL